MKVSQMPPNTTRNSIVHLGDLKLIEAQKQLELLRENLNATKGNIEQSKQT